MALSKIEEVLNYLDGDDWEELRIRAEGKKADRLKIEQVLDRGGYSMQWA